MREGEDRAPEWGRVGSAVAVMAPVLAVAGLAVSVVLLVDGLGVLGNWTTILSDRGTFTVSGCVTSRELVFDSVECTGELVPDDGGPTRSVVLVGPLSAVGSSPPPAGTEIEVYANPGVRWRVYPIGGRSTELARVVIGMVPKVFLVGGFGAWLLGWLLTCRIDPAVARTMPDRVRFPQRFSLRSGGRAWILVGAVLSMGDRYFLDDLLGTAGLG